MRQILALVLVVLTFVHAEDETVVPSRWHSLEDQGGSGYSLLLAEVGDEMFTLYRYNGGYSVIQDMSGSVWAYKCLESDDNSTDPELEWIGAGLYFLNNRTEEIEKGREGLLVVHFSDHETDGWLSGTVCDDKFNDHAADLSCQYLGYESAEEWGSEKDSKWGNGRQFIPASILVEYNIDILVDDVYCDESKTNITECEADVLEGHDCNIFENLWLKCAGNSSEPEWRFEQAYLMKYQDDALSYGFEGLLLVTLRDRNDPAVSQTGTVCDDSFNDHAANLSCQYLGYKYAVAWGSAPQNDNYIPEHIYEFLKDPPILVDDVQCDEWTTSIMECEARFINHDCSRSENLWLKCSEDEEEEGTEEEGTEEQGLELEFGGAKLNLNLNKIHTKWNF
ncbi:neurotrypsin-like [Bolinopsis microptera]|uniref:neurotrypsin-like n=1 Tax=Bolinopsis microptera TaxID=2820187 RepID=UPI003079EF4B